MLIGCGVGVGVRKTVAVGGMIAVGLSSKTIVALAIGVGNRGDVDSAVNDDVGTLGAGAPQAERIRVSKNTDKESLFMLVSRFVVFCHFEGAARRRLTPASAGGAREVFCDG